MDINSKREEITKGLIQILGNGLYHSYTSKGKRIQGTPMGWHRLLSEEILFYLHSQGVVIETENTDINIWLDKTKNQLVKEHDWYGQGLFDMYMDMITKYNYIHAEPLIKE